MTGARTVERFASVMLDVSAAVSAPTAFGDFKDIHCARDILGCQGENGSPSPPRLRWAETIGTPAAMTDTAFDSCNAVGVSLGMGAVRRRAGGGAAGWAMADLAVAGRFAEGPGRRAAIERLNE